MSVGVASVGIYPSNLPPDCEYIINHSDAVLIFVENRVQLEKILEIRERLAKIRQVILFEGAYPDDEWVISFDAFMALGQEIGDAAFDQRANAVRRTLPAGWCTPREPPGFPRGWS